MNLFNQYVSSNFTDRETLTYTGSLPADRIDFLLTENERLDLLTSEQEVKIEDLTEQVEALQDEIKKLQAELSPFEFRQYTIGSHFVSAIINNDYSGLEDHEVFTLNRFLSNQVGEFWTLDPDNEQTNFAMCEVGEVMSDCTTLLLAVRKPNR